MVIHVVGLVLWAGCGSPPGPGGAPAAPAEVEAAVPPAPAPPLGRPAQPLFSAPFTGEAVASNAFDHAPQPQPAKGQLDMRGEWSAGTAGHRGWDWRLPIGTPVQAMADGVVLYAGVVPPFPCAALGRTVSDQRTVIVQHTDGGAVFDVVFDHLERVDVRKGQPVRRGDVIGQSGNSGCSTGPHLHLEVARELGGRRLSVDPYGWLGEGPDPWADAPQGAASVWLWRDAPVPWREVERAPGEADQLGPVFVRAVRYAGWDDAAHPSNERIVLEADPRVVDGHVDLEGWALVGGDDQPHALPAGTSVSVETPLEVFVGRGVGSADGLALGLEAPMLPDGGGTVRLLDPSGGLVHLFRYGLASRRDRAPSGEALACGPADPGCVPVPLPGPVGPLAFSPDGHWLAARVGGGLALLPGHGEEEALLHEELGTVDREPRGGLAWRGDEQVLLELGTSDDARKLWSVVLGMQPAPAFPPRRDTQLGLADAGAGGAVLFLRSPAGVTLGQWRPGRAEVRALRTPRMPEASVALSPDGGRVAYTRGGAVEVLDLATGEPRVLRRDLADDALLGWLGDDVVVQELDRLLRVRPDGGPVPVLGGLQRGVLGRDPGGRWSAVQKEDGVLVVVDVAGRVLTGPLVATPVTAVAVVEDQGGVELAWASPPQPLASPALYRVRLAPEAAARPSGRP